MTIQNQNNTSSKENKKRQTKGIKKATTPKQQIDKKQTKKQLFRAIPSLYGAATSRK